MEEAKRLVSDGAVELNLVGQDTSYYGADLYGRPRLAELLEKLSRISGIRWIRVLYAHPAHVTDALIQAIRDLPNVVKYVDIPLQHINDALLSAMRRETDGGQIRRLIDRFRREIPGVALRTTFITGFPGETEDQVKELEEFMKEARFERLGIFPYSPEPKTPSERMPGQLSEEIRQERFGRLMRLQQGIAKEINEQWLGREIEVLVDEPVDEPGTVQARDTLQSRVSPSGLSPIYLGRTTADAPEVDGQVFIRSQAPLSAGQLVRARVVDTSEYDLVAEAG